MHQELPGDGVMASGAESDVGALGLGEVVQKLGAPEGLVPRL
jgi:hypothetical protein